MEMPKPNAQHAKLQQLVGTWVGEEKMHPSPWSQSGGTAIGRVFNRPSLDGFVVVQDYEHERDGKVNFRGHGVFTWDQTENCYILYWFDSMGFPPNIYKGTFDNSVLRMISKTSQGQVRATWDFSKRGVNTYLMELSQDGQQWSAMVDGSYKLARP